MNMNENKKVNQTLVHTKVTQLNFIIINKKTQPDRCCLDINVQLTPCCPE